MNAIAFPNGIPGRADRMRTAASVRRPRTWAVHLIDRRSGLVHRANGHPLVVFTRDPDHAGSDLLRNRDTSIWAIRTTLIDPEAQT